MKTLRLRATLLALALLGTSANARPALWMDLAPTDVDASTPVRVRTLQHRAVALDLAAIRAELAAAPMERSAPLDDSTAIIALPTPDGGIERFRIEAAPILSPEIARQFPTHMAYRGQGIDDPTATLTLVLNDLGVTAQVLTPRGSWYIDPMHAGDTDRYAVYAKSDMDTSQRPARDCGFAPTAEELAARPPVQALFADPRASNMRSYRLAVSATGEYTAFHGGQSQAFSAIQTTFARVRGIYERELSVTFTLVSGTNTVFTDAGSDPFTNDDGPAMLGENQSTLAEFVGLGNFDVGHVVSTGGGGIAGLGVVCLNNQKGRGVTGSAAPIGDPFDVDYVAHEIGHQFGGNHTFNSEQGACGGNREASVAVEPGSGSTIQAYAGICTSDNVQSNSDAMFSHASLAEMGAFIASATCASLTANGNNPPVANAPASKTIPPRTPFMLVGSGSDPDGDTVTFSWEQSDAAPNGSRLTDADNGAIPRFRAFLPVSTPMRLFPSLPILLTGAEPTGGGERFFTASATHKFILTARDNRADGGLTAFAQTNITVDASKTPFRVTSPNSAATLTGNTSATVTWDPEAPSAAGLLAQNVDILVSMDGGANFGTVAAGLPNNGSASFTVPNSTTSNARIMVKASDNHFFDINDANLTIEPGTGPSPTPTGEPSPTPTVTPTPTGGCTSGCDPQEAVQNLTPDFWVARELPAFFGVPQLGFDNGLRLAVPTYTESRGYFGFFETITSLRMDQAGTYQFLFEIEGGADVVGRDNPECRIRVFSPDGLYQRFASTAERGDTKLRTEVPVFVTVDAGEELKIAIDLLSFDPTLEGSFTIRSITLTRIGD